MSTTRPKRNVLTLRLRRLAALLLQMREAAGVTREDVSIHTGINETTLYRIESARVRPQRRTLVALLDLYGVAEPDRGDALQLFAEAGTPGMSRSYQFDVAEEYAAFINFEAEALSIRNYESLYVPGLLQTERYARAAIEGWLPMADPADMENRVTARMDRAVVLTKSHPLEVWAVMDEAAIRRVVGSPEIMAEQLAHLLEVAKSPTVTLQVIPFDAGAHPGMHGSFVIMDFPDPTDPELVYVEGIAGEQLLEGDAEVRRYGLLFDHIRAMALSPKKTLEFIFEATHQLDGSA